MSIRDILDCCGSISPNFCCKNWTHMTDTYEVNHLLQRQTSLKRGYWNATIIGSHLRNSSIQLHLNFKEQQHNSTDKHTRHFTQQISTPMTTQRDTNASKSWVDILREKASDDTRQLDAPQYHKLTVTESLQFILQVLDQGTTLFNSRSITKLLIALEVLKSSPDYQVYSSYNELKTNTSLITVLLYSNYLLSHNVSSFYMDSLPSPILSRFKTFELSPLSKPEEFVTNPSDLLNESQKPEKMYLLQMHVLELIDHYLDLECQNLNNEISPMQTKLFISFFNLLLASLDRKSVV